MIKKNLCLSIFLGALLVMGGESVSAAGNPIELGVSVSHDANGYVTFTCPLPIATYPNIEGFEMYSGSYPDTSTRILSQTFSASVCSVVSAGYGYLEDGYLNNSLVTDNGNYWVRFTYSGDDSTNDFSGDWFFFKASRVGGLWSAIESSRIVSFSPSGIVVNPTTNVASTTADVDVVIQAYLDDADANLYDQVVLELTNVENFVDYDPIFFSILYPGGVAFSTTLADLPFGQYRAKVSMASSTSASKSLTREFAFINMYTGVSVDLSGLFGSNFGTTTGALIIDGQVRENCAVLDGVFDRATCGLLNGLKDLTSFLFRPSAASLANFDSLPDRMKTKAPFSYAYDANVLRQELFTASSTASTTFAVSTKFIPGHSTSTITFLSASMLSAVPYASRIKDILGWILWFFAIEYIYFRVIRSHDNQTPS